MSSAVAIVVLALVALLSASNALCTQASRDTEVLVDTKAALLDIVVNEVAWMGTTTSYNDEWIELYNSTGSSVAPTYSLISQAFTCLALL